MTAEEPAPPVDPGALRPVVERAVDHHARVDSLVVQPESRLVLIKLSLPRRLSEGERLEVEARVQEALWGIDGTHTGGYWLVPLFPPTR